MEYKKWNFLVKNDQQVDEISEQLVTRPRSAGKTHETFIALGKEISELKAKNKELEGKVKILECVKLVNLQMEKSSLLDALEESNIALAYQDNPKLEALIDKNQALITKYRR
jgi:hypothetical protein